MRSCFPFATLLLAIVLVVSLGSVSAESPAGAPLGNPYDVLGRVFRPFTNVLMRDGRDPEKAMDLQFQISKVEGRLPSQFQGAVLSAWVENPDKLRLEAPVFGELFTVVRNGNEVWATPGDKVEFLLSQFQHKPPPTAKPHTPLFVPITAQQAVFLVALFELRNREVAEIDVVEGSELRVLTGGLMQDLAKAASADDFVASIWVDGTYRPRRMEIQRRDFSVLVDFLRVSFTPSLPASTWQLPAGEENVYRTTADHLEAVLYVVVNSLHTDSNDKPWEVER